MLRKTDRDDAAQGPPAASRQQTSRQLLGELLRLGFEPELSPGDLGLCAGGAGFRLSARAFSQSQAGIERELERVRALLTLGMPVTVSITDIGRRGEERLERVLRRLHRATADRCIDRRRLSLAVRAQDLPLPAFLLVSRSWLGNGPRFVLLDGAPADAASGLWSALYQQRAWQRGLRPAAAAAVRTCCPLLSDEVGDVPVSRHALLAPPQTAWLPLAVNVCRYCDRQGIVKTQRLHAALRRGLELADRLFDRLQWPARSLQRDARQNRRIVFVVQGLGDLVALRRADPGGIDLLRDLERLVGGMHTLLWDTSRQLARERGALPSLAERDPTQGFADGAEKRGWQRRWRDALASSAVRHRNLLALSPYALLPNSGTANSAYLDLLPLLAHADVLSFAGGFCFTGWRIQEYKAFHGRTAATLERRNRTAFVATGV